MDRDLRTVVATVLELLLPLADGKHLILVEDLPADLPPVDADEHRLEQILLNLVSNAIKFTDSGHVTISARVEGKSVSISVRDTGIGIPSEQQERIFRAFEQADGSLARQLGGTGLGLAVSRRLVELHGGELSVVSVPGEGTTFTFTLPAAEADAETAPIAESGGDAAERRASFLLAEESGVVVAQAVRSAQSSEGPTLLDDEAHRILVVDDEPINRMIIRSQLEVSGYAVVEAVDGFQALERLEGVDLVLLDIMMPRRSGYEVCRELRKDHSPAELPVIFVTAKSRPEDLEEGFAVGGNDYLVKPVGKGELLARIAVQLELSRSSLSTISPSAAPGPS